MADSGAVLPAVGGLPFPRSLLTPRPEAVHPGVGADQSPQGRPEPAVLRKA